MAPYDGLLFIWFVLNQQRIYCFLQEYSVAEFEGVDGAKQPAHVGEDVVGNPIGKVGYAMLDINEPVANVFKFVRI